MVDNQPCGQVWSENILTGLNVTQIVFFRYNITIPPGAGCGAYVQFSQDNATWVSSNGIAEWECLTSGDNKIPLTGLDWAGNFYYRINMCENATGASPELDLVQVCYSTTPPGAGGWNIVMWPMIGAVVIYLAFMIMRRR